MSLSEVFIPFFSSTDKSKMFHLRRGRVDKTQKSIMDSLGD